MSAIANDVRAQRLDIIAGRLKTFWRRCDPYQFAAGLKHRITAGPNATTDGIEHHIADGTDRGEILGIVVDHLVSAETAHIGVIVGARSCDHACAKMFAELYGESRNATRATLD